MTSIGGNTELKEIGLAIGTSGTHYNTEIDEATGHLRLIGNSEGDYVPEGYWISDVVDLQDKFTDFEKVFATEFQNQGSSYSIHTRTSNDGINFDEWLPVAMDGTIMSETKQFIQVKINLFAGYSDETNPIDLSTVEPLAYVEYDEDLKLKTEYTFDMAQDGEVARHLVSRDDFKRIDGLEVVPTNPLLIYHDGKYKKWKDVEKLVPYLISNNDKGFIVTASSVLAGVYYQPFKSFDGLDDSINGWAATTTSGWLMVESPYPIIVNHYKIKPRRYNDGTNANAYGVNQAPKNWTFEGSNDGVNWIILDTRANITNYNYGIFKEFDFENDTAYSHHRIVVTAINGSTTFLTIGEIEFYNSERMWLIENNIQNGSTDAIPYRQPTQLSSSTMTVKSGILPESDTGKLYSENLDLIEYPDIQMLNSNIFSKDGKFYTFDEAVYEVDDTVNVALGKSSSASSNYSISSDSSKAFDGNNTTYWQPSGTPTLTTPQWIAVNLDKYIRVNRYFIRTGGSSSNYNPSRWILQGYSGNAWVDLDARVVTLGNNTTYYYDFVNTKLFNRIRLYVQGTRGWDLCLYEFGIYASNLITPAQVREITPEEIPTTFQPSFDVTGTDGLFYDFFGDSVEVLHYDATGTSPTPQLQVTANWSPLDELEGDFEVVTLAEDNVPRQLQLTAIPHPQFVKTVLIEDVKDITKITATNSGNAKYLISPNGTDWYRYMSGHFEQVQESDVALYGMTADEINALTQVNWQSWSEDSFSVGIYIPNENTVVNEVNYTAALPTSTHEVKNTSFYILNTTARIDVILEGTLLTAYLSDEDMTRIKYRVLVNGVPYRQSDTNEEGWTELSAPPKNILMNLYDESIVNINAYNTVRIEFQDFWSSTDYWEAQFYARKKKKGYSYAFVVYH